MTQRTDLKAWQNNLTVEDCPHYTLNGKSLLVRYAIQNRDGQYVFHTSPRALIPRDDPPTIFKSLAAANRVYMDIISLCVRNDSLYQVPQTVFLKEMIITRESNNVQILKSETHTILNLHEQFVAYQVGKFDKLFHHHTSPARGSLRLYRKLLRREDFRDFQIMVNIGASHSDAFRVMDHQVVAYNDHWLALKNRDDLALARVAFEIGHIVDLKNNDELSGKDFDNYLNDSA